MIDRMDRISEMIKRKVSFVLGTQIDDPRIAHVTVTRVEVTRDLMLAKVFYALSGDEDEKEKKAIAKGLKSAGGFIRGELAKKVSMKFTPRISFREDLREERKESIDDIFDRIEKERSQDQDK